MASLQLCMFEIYMLSTMNYEKMSNYMSNTIKLKKTLSLTEISNVTLLQSMKIVSYFKNTGGRKIYLSINGICSRK